MGCNVEDEGDVLVSKDIKEAFQNLIGEADNYT